MHVTKSASLEKATAQSIKRLAPRNWPLREYRWRKVTSGMSGADVFRLDHEIRPSLFLKTDSANQFSEVAAEAQRLPWLIGAGIRCPSVIKFATHSGRNWLLTRALVGRTMDRAPRVEVLCTVQQAALALKTLHSVPVNSCPFDNRLRTRLRAAHARLDAGYINIEDFRSRNAASKALTKLEREAPRTRRAVLTHGDACLENLLEHKGRFVGFVDCGRVGIADPYQDLALACDSISEHFGAKWSSSFLTHYGIAEPNEAKMRFYMKLDAFY